MSGPELHQTRMGTRFFEADIPRLVKALERIADALEEANERERKKEPAQDGKPQALNEGA